MVILRGKFDISPEDIITRYKLQDLVHIDVSAYVLGGVLKQTTIMVY